MPYEQSNKSLADETSGNGCHYIGGLLGRTLCDWFHRIMMTPRAVVIQKDIRTANTSARQGPSGDGGLHEIHACSSCYHCVLCISDGGNGRHMQAGARCIEALRASVTSSTRCLFVLSRATCPTAISPRALCGQFTQRRGFRYARKVRPEAKYRLPQSQSLPPRPPCPTIWSVTEGSPNLIEEQAERTSVEELERELLWNARHHPNLFAVEHLLEYLVVKRNVQPAVPHYEALILANCDPLLGSADYAASVIDDMEQNGIQAPSLADAAMLQVWITYY